jgi:alpha-L-arabinofuranosidase
MIKKRCIEENFEGTIYRQHHSVAEVESSGTVLTTGVKDDWLALLEGATYTVLSGPDRGQTGKVLSLEHVGPEGWRGRTRMRLDKPFRPHPEQNGLLLERMRLDEGAVVGFKCYDWRTRHDWSQSDRVSDQNEYTHDDVPPGSFGTTAMNLKGSQEPAFISFHAMSNDSAGTNGEWHARFWARAKAGEPVLTAGPSGLAEPAELRPGSEWEQYERTFTIEREPEPRNVDFRFDVTAGDVLLDDIEVWIEGDANPTPFRDDMVEVLQEYAPGVMRLLHNDGNTVANVLGPRLEAYMARGCTYESIKRRQVSVHEFYELCEYIGCGAWATLPGTVKGEDIDQFMEYIGAPADVGFGGKRAAWGHPRPWTETLDRIYVQFGNENITFPGTGYRGPDYWKELIARGKSSPYYKPNVVFVLEYQGGRQNLENVPNADIFCIGNYLLASLTNEEMDSYLNTTDKMFRYVFAYPYWKWVVRETANPYRTMSYIPEFNVEPAVYEGGNYHLTFGDAPPEERNKIVTSIGGQVNTVNSMLFLMKKYGVRAQNKFNLSQFSFTGGGSFGSGVSVRLWGNVISMRKGARRYRPGFLAAQMANKVIAGDLVETVHEGADPRFSATGIFEKKRQAGVFSGDPMTIENVPVLYSYAFKEGNRRAVIIVSVDTSDPHDVQLEFEGQVKGAKAQRWTLTADDITANNEPEVGEPQVAIREAAIDSFGSPYRITIPPFSMIALEWETQ